jgi:outer membrane protein
MTKTNGAFLVPFSGVFNYLCSLFQLYQAVLFSSVSLSLVALFFLSTATFAASEVVNNAQRELANGNPKQAYMLLIAEQGKLGGDPEFDYLLGVAALDSGKVDDAIIAFERVLTKNPKNAGAQLDLGRAYFTAGTFDLAEATFLVLKRSNPPASAMLAITRYLEAINARKKKTTRSTIAWGETSLGYDTNLTGVPNDFSAAVASSFNLVGIDPTGNSIKRKAPYVGAAVGADVEQPINRNWSALLTGELRGRAYRNESDFNSLFGELRGGAGWTGGEHQLRMLLGGSYFSQEAQAPGEPKPTNDRRGVSLSADYRFAVSQNQQINIGLTGAQTRFPKNDIEDINSVVFTGGWTKTFGGNGTPIIQLSGFFGNDKAVRKLADDAADKSKRIGGLRAYAQYSVTEKLALFNSTGYTMRNDQSGFARATETEFGRDKLFDTTLGVNWRFKPPCNLRAQWFFSKNQSNIAIYDYTRSEISSNIRCNFE